MGWTEERACATLAPHGVRSRSSRKKQPKCVASPNSRGLFQPHLASCRTEALPNPSAERAETWVALPVAADAVDPDPLPGRSPLGGGHLVAVKVRVGVKVWLRGVKVRVGGRVVVLVMMVFHGALRLPPMMKIISPFCRSFFSSSSPPKSLPFVPHTSFPTAEGVAPQRRRRPPHSPSPARRRPPLAALSNPSEPSRSGPWCSLGLNPHLSATRCQ